MTIVDAGPLIAWLDAADQWHGWADDALSRCLGPLRTTEIVLGEACHLLGGNAAPVHALLDCVRRGSIILHPLWPGHLERTQQLMLKYEKMDAADASLVVLSELYRQAPIVTLDTADFRVYRRFRRDPLPIVAP
jgi:predicted nucleic acid-binding protein